MKLQDFPAEERSPKKEKTPNYSKAFSQEFQRKDSLASMGWVPPTL